MGIALFPSPLMGEGRGEGEIKMPHLYLPPRLGGGERGRRLL